jgi:glucose/arabinose dehydrogenase
MNHVSRGVSSHQNPLVNSTWIDADPSLLPKNGRAESGQSSSIAFIDSTVENYQKLVAGIAPGTEVVILDANQDGIQQISNVLAQRHTFSAIHIVSHGDADGVQLGDARLEYGNLDRYRSQIQSWSGHLSEDADILFYGCNVAARNDQLIQQIDRLTGADVAASDDLTGSATLGGDWDLEVQTGAIESGLAFQPEVLEAYDATLASFNYSNFASTSGLTLNGNAARSGNALRLTPATAAQVGSAFYTTPISVNADTSFQTQFQFNLSGGTSGADGFTFVLQNDPDGAAAIAEGGGNLGYGSGTNAITSSLAIEFDTFQNTWDTGNNQISLLRDGAITAPLATVTPTLDLNSGSAINAWVDYNGATNRLEVFLSSSTTKPATAVLTQTIDLAAVVGSRAFVGFTGGTGGLNNAQDINQWQFSSTDPGTIGGGNGLRAEYFDNIDFVGTSVTRIDPTVNFNWGSGSPDPTIASDTFSARWSGQIQPRFSETYTFFTNTDDGVRLFVNNQLVIDNYRDQSPTERSGTITLQAGQKYDIRMEYYERTGGAVAQLSWASASQTKQIVPQSQLFGTLPPATGGNNGLKGEYFDNRDFTNLKFTRTDPTIDFNWNGGSPAASIGNDTFSVRWTGQVQPLYSETYTFSTTTDDGLQLYVDDRLIIDHLRDQAPTEKTGTITLEAGRRYNIRMDYYENAGNALARLAWASPSQVKQIIPNSQLFDSVAANPGILSLADTQISVNEGVTTANITVQRTGGSAGVATLDYTTLDGSATAGSDYSARSGTLTFADGVTSQVISIPILEDTLVEGNELFSVAVDRPTGATLRAPRTAQVTIIDNDVPTGENFVLDFPNFANVSQLQLNGNASATSNVLRLTPAAQNQAGSAFYKDVLTLDANTSFQTQFQFRLSGGQGSGGADGFTFMLQDTFAGSSILGGNGGGLGYGGTGAKSLAIKFDTYDNGAADPSDNYIAIVRDGAVDVNLASVGTALDLNNASPLNAWVDYNGTTDRLEIFLANTPTKPGTPLLAQTLDLTAILGNSAYVGFSGGTGGLFNNQDIENWRFTTNAEVSRLGFSQPRYTIDEAAGTATITVRRGVNSSAGAASVSYATSNGTAIAGSDYTARSGVLNFAAGDLEESFTIPITNDTEVERNETINITLSNAVGATLASQNTAVLTIADNDVGNFARDVIVTGLNLPTAFEWAAGSERLYIAEKGGVVKVVENGVTSTFLDLSAEVNSAPDNDRGLLAMTLHPNFSVTPYVYLGYTYDPPEARTPTPAAALDERDRNGNRPSRLIRVTADASTGYKTVVPGSAVVLLGTNSNWAYTSRPDANSTDQIDLPPSGINNGTTINAPQSLIDGNGNIRDYLATDSQSHTIGDVMFGTDGSLFVSNGDGTSFGRTDPRTRRVQDLDNLSGKVLRIDPITGAGLSDNPFYQSSNPNSNRSKVYSYGLRNPFRMTLNRANNEPVIGDVGWTNWEEINTGRGRNFGWPYYEGGNGVSLQTGGYSSQPEAPAFYAGTTVTPAIYARSHADGAAAISMGDYYNGTTFPSIYQGGVFFSDIVSGEVDVLLFNPDGSVNSVKRFASGSDFTYISQMTTRNSDLYYASLQTGTISRWRAV